MLTQLLICRRNRTYSKSHGTDALTLIWCFISNVKIGTAYRRAHRSLQCVGGMIKPLYAATMLTRTKLHGRRPWSDYSLYDSGFNFTTLFGRLNVQTQQLRTPSDKLIRKLSENSFLPRKTGYTFFSFFSLRRFLCLWMFHLTLSLLAFCVLTMSWSTHRSG